MGTTLNTLIQRAQRESDNLNSSFIDNTLPGGEWSQYINAAYNEVYGLVIQAYSGHYYTQLPSSGYTFTTDGINNFFALPTDMFKLLGVDVLYGANNQWVSLRPFTLLDRNRFSGSNQSIPAAGQTVRVFYIPKLTPLVNGTDATVDLQNDWEQLIVTTAAITALTKEESDTSAMMMKKASLVQRIEREAENRDAGEPPRIQDTRGRGSPMMAYAMNGSNLWLIGQRVIGQPWYGYAMPEDGWW